MPSITLQLKSLYFQPILYSLKKLLILRPNQYQHSKLSVANVMFTTTDIFLEASHKS
jgi:hypothetical protein